MEIDETDGKDGHIYRLKKIDEIQEILIAERDKGNKLSIKYNGEVNIIGLGITGVSLLSTIVAAPAVVGIETISNVMRFLRVVGNRAIIKDVVEIEKHEKIAMLTVSTLSSISSLISKALSDISISDEEYALNLIGV